MRREEKGMLTKINRAIVSVTDKSGLGEFGKSLMEMGVQIISTGGTAKFLKSEGVNIIDISDYTGFPEIMDGR
ncbi:MAG: bifunctional phosphoribosylaminoimidazolecarboxamide formyltransferase/IMP cyclohydrolase, partial [Desulfatiglandales bacterium]